MSVFPVQQSVAGVEVELINFDRGLLSNMDKPVILVPYHRFDFEAGIRRHDRQ